MSGATVSWSPGEVDLRAVLGIEPVGLTPSLRELPLCPADPALRPGKQLGTVLSAPGISLFEPGLALLTHQILGEIH